jgi:hypothetical protein
MTIRLVAGQSGRGEMASQDNYRATIEETRKIYRAMISRLRTSGEDVFDELARKLYLGKLETFLDHFEEMNDPKEIQEFFLLSYAALYR